MRAIPISTAYHYWPDLIYRIYQVQQNRSKEMTPKPVWEQKQTEEMWKKNHNINNSIISKQETNNFSQSQPEL